MKGTFAGFLLWSDWLILKLIICQLVVNSTSDDVQIIASSAFGRQGTQSSFAKAAEQYLCLVSAKSKTNSVCSCVISA